MKNQLLPVLLAAFGLIWVHPMTAQDEAVAKSVVKEGYVEENLIIPVKSYTNAEIRVDNRKVAIDGLWVFKDDQNEVLNVPKIVGQPEGIEDRLFIALRSPGQASVYVTEEGVTTEYKVNVKSRFKENIIEKELEEAILKMVNDPGLRVTVLPPQATLVGANLRRAFGDETASEIVAPRGEAAGNSTGQITNPADYRPVIVLEGELANDLRAVKAVNVAHAYTDSVINLMSVRNHVQVQIKVNVLSVTLTKNSDIGIQYGTRVGGIFRPGFNLPLNVQNAFSAGAPFFSVINANAISDFQAQLNAAMRNGSVKLLQSPTITVLNGQPAEFLAGTLITVPSRVAVSDGVPVQEFAERQIGVTLRISPISREETTFRPRVDGTIPFSTISVQDRKTTRTETPDTIDNGVREQVVNSIDENGVIRLLIQPSISTLGRADELVNGLRTTNTNQLETRVAMRHGETMIMGGLFTNEDQKNLESIPFIEKIPILGELFKNRSNSNLRQELVFTLTPYIVGLDGFGDQNDRAVTSPLMERELQSNEIRTKPVRISSRDVYVRDAIILADPSPTPAPENLNVRPEEQPAPTAPAETAPGSTVPPEVVVPIVQ
jgi:Flp pilus assembly secretin CpaC